MGVENAGRLALELDDTGLLVRLRRRPNAFNLKVGEEPLLLASPTAIDAPTREFVDEPLHGTRPLRLLKLSTQIRIDDLTLKRILRCALVGTIQRTELLELDYFLSGRAHHQSLLRVHDASKTASTSNGDDWIIFAHPYYIDVRVLTRQGPVDVTLKIHHGDGASAEVAVSCQGDAFLRLGIRITDSEKLEEERVIHAVPVPIDLEPAVLAVSTPPFLWQRNQTAPWLSLSLPPRLLAFPRQPTDAGQLVYPESRGGDLRYGSLEKLFRTALIAIFYGSVDLDEFVRPMFDYLRALNPGQLSSLISILWLSPSQEFLSSLSTYLAAEPLILKRLEGHVPTLCQNILVYSAARTFEDLWHLIAEHQRSVFRTIDNSSGSGPASATDDSSVVVVPRDAELPLMIALLSAARLRSGCPRVIAGRAIPSSAETWPEMPAGSGYELCAKIAECLHADLVTGEAAGAAPAEVSDPWRWYREQWPISQKRVLNGEIALERLILVEIGSDRATALLKSLPALFYSSTPPAPVLGFQMPHDLDSKIGEALKASLVATENASSRIALGRKADHKSTWQALSQSRERLQRLLLEAIPSAYVDLIRRQRPAELIAFTNLPFEWLEIDGIPLGYLTKISKIRLESGHGPIYGLFDLVRAYRSLTNPDYQPRAEGFRVLCIAPIYSGFVQRRVNNIIQSMVIALRSQIQKQIDLKKDIAFEALHDKTVDAIRVVSRLREPWDLVFYVGHAGHGHLHLSTGAPLDVSRLPPNELEGAVVVLVGCTTEGISNLAGSIANEMLALGARAVISFPGRLHANVVQEMMWNLPPYLIASNMLFGDTVQITRFSVFFSYAWLHSLALGAQASRRRLSLEKIASGDIVIASPADSDYPEFHNGWDRYYRHVVNYLREFNPTGPVPPEEVARRAAAIGLNLSLSGNLRDRLFTF